MRVEWTGRALDRFVALFEAADPADQEEIERDVLAANRDLANDPWELGESRSRLDRRIWFPGRLVLVFRIYRADGIVVVSDAALSGRPR